MKIQKTIANVLFCHGLAFSTYYLYFALTGSPLGIVASILMWVLISVVSHYVFFDINDIVNRVLYSTALITLLSLLVSGLGLFALYQIDAKLYYASLIPITLIGAHIAVVFAPVCMAMVQVLMRIKTKIDYMSERQSIFNSDHSE